jgi:predicted transcriptional regulator
MNGKAKVIRVSDVMEQDYALVDGATTVAEALQMMRDKHVNLLIVDKRDEDDEYGIVLVADIAKHVLAQNRAPERCNVYEIMAKPVLSVHPDMHIRYCARLFQNFGISTAPVIDANGKIRGIVAYDELVLKGLAEYTY